MQKLELINRPIVFCAHAKWYVIMYPLYKKDKTEYVPTRMNPDLLTRIENFMKANNIGAWNRSKAIRALIELGLSVSDSTIHSDTELSRSQIIETEVIERTEKITRQKIINLENIKGFFPKDLTELLTFEPSKKNVLLKTKHWVSKEEWMQINHVVKNHDGEWISDKDQSRWIMPLI